jgi:hypothetical protein
MGHITQPPALTISTTGSVLVLCYRFDGQSYLI